MASQHEVGTANQEKARSADERQPEMTVNPGAAGSWGKADPIQMRRAVADPITATPAGILSLQRAFGNRATTGLLAGPRQPLQAKGLGTASQSGYGQGQRSGLPPSLKFGLEHLSGYALDDVTVHHNSSEPARFKARAFTQGTEIHVAPGQEEHLAHEGWHVIQQKQGRVRPTLQLKGITLNDETGLEHEADVMGARAQSLNEASSRPLQRGTVSEGVIQGKVYADNFHALIEEQEKLQEGVINNGSSDKYTTVGFEHEFAQMTDGPLQGVSHQVLSHSTKEMPFTKIPFILETDADNAVELISPPFLIETLPESPVPDPDDIEKVDNMMKTELATYAEASSNLEALVGTFGSQAGLDFPLCDVSVQRENMTPNTKPEIYNNNVLNKLWKVDDRSKVKADTLKAIGIGFSKKGAHGKEKHHISTHVNIATDAETYDELQDQYDPTNDPYMETFTAIEEQLKRLLFSRAFASHVEASKAGSEAAIAAVKEAQRELQSGMQELKSHIAQGKTTLQPETVTVNNSHLWRSRVSGAEGAVGNAIAAFNERCDSVEQLASAPHLTIAQRDRACSLFEEAINAGIEAIERGNKAVMREFSDRTIPPEVTSALQRIGPLREAASFKLGSLPIPSESNGGLRIFLNALARNLAGQIAVESVHRVRKAQKKRFAKASRPMEHTLYPEQMLSSRVKDVKQVWVKDTIMNVGLGVLTAPDWGQVQKLVTDASLENEIGAIQIPDLEWVKNRGGIDVARGKKQFPSDVFTSSVMGALGQIDQYIGDHGLTNEETDSSDTFISPESQPEFMTHASEWIGPRQDTYIGARKVQMPQIWGKKRLHVVEVRLDAADRLRKLRERRGPPRFRVSGQENKENLNDGLLHLASRRNSNANDDYLSPISSNLPSFGLDLQHPFSNNQSIIEEEPMQKIIQNEPMQNIKSEPMQNIKSEPIEKAVEKEKPPQSNAKDQLYWIDDDNEDWDDDDDDEDFQNVYREDSAHL